MISESRCLLEDLSLEFTFMLAKRVIPCLDVDGGRVVKGVNFVGLLDAGDPVECGKRYDQAGADELVFLDITASSEARNIVVDALHVGAAMIGGVYAAEQQQRCRRRAPHG